MPSGPTGSAQRAGTARPRREPATPPRGVPRHVGEERERIPRVLQTGATEPLRVHPALSLGHVREPEQAVARLGRAKVGEDRLASIERRRCTEPCPAPRGRDRRRASRRRDNSTLPAPTRATLVMRARLDDRRHAALGGTSPPPHPARRERRARRMRRRRLLVFAVVRRLYPARGLPKRGGRASRPAHSGKCVRSVGVSRRRCGAASPCRSRCPSTTCRGGSRARPGSVPSGSPCRSRHPCS